MAQSSRESGIGLPHSTTSRKKWCAVHRASVVECGSPMPLFLGDCQQRPRKFMAKCMCKAGGNLYKSNVCTCPLSTHSQNFYRDAIFVWDTAVTIYLDARHWRQHFRSG